MYHLKPQIQDTNESLTKDSQYLRTIQFIQLISEYLMNMVNCYTIVHNLNYIIHILRNVLAVVYSILHAYCISINKHINHITQSVQHRNNYIVYLKSK